ncbi:hypothetical protein [Anaeroselena agilis]|uniref:Uncharacterized protein n=1 Tax=Anaeroselena agilis TaxID=3063788 RepID=A0ABU3NVT7_9FIRM|nr:hypothetical protein [Selenomonadales bacterium 4137-cl]
MKKVVIPTNYMDPRWYTSPNHVNGSFGSDGTKILVTSFGGDNGDWHGPGIKMNLSEKIPLWRDFYIMFRAAMTVQTSSGYLSSSTVALMSQATVPFRMQCYDGNADGTTSYTYVDGPTGHVLTDSTSGVTAARTVEYQNIGGILTIRHNGSLLYAGNYAPGFQQYLDAIDMYTYQYTTYSTYQCTLEAFEYWYTPEPRRGPTIYLPATYKASMGRW